MKKLRGVLFGMTGLGCFQGFIGWWMVKSGLKNKEQTNEVDKTPRVSPYRLAVHAGIAYQPGSHVEDVSHWLGYQLAEQGVPVQTGGGDGVMSAVLEAYKERRGELAEFQAGGPGDLRTQAINIKLPWEQKLNDHVEVSHEVPASIGLLYRELGIYLNSVGIGILTGGVGTANELFDLWSRKLSGQHQDAIGVDATYWGPLLRSVKSSAEARGLMNETEWSAIDLSNDRTQAYTKLDPAGGRNEREETSSRLISQAFSCVDSLTEASAPMVTFLGSNRLAASDPTCEAAAEMAHSLAEEGVPLKIGGAGALPKAVKTAARVADPGAEMQTYLMDAEAVEYGTSETPGRTVSDAITKQMALALRSRAIVAAPGDVHTIADLLSVLVLSYVNAIPKQPIVLLGSDYWTPVVKELKQTMLNDSFPTASKGILDRVTITDDPKVALDAIRNPKNLPK